MVQPLTLGVTSASGVSNLLIAVLLGVAALASILNPRDALVRRFAVVLALSALAVKAASMASPHALAAAAVEVGTLGLLPGMFVDFCLHLVQRHAPDGRDARGRRAVARAVSVGSMIVGLIALVAVFLGGWPVTLARVALVVAQISSFVFGVYLLAQACRRGRLCAVVGVVGAGACVAFGPIVVTVELPALFGQPPMLPFGTVVICLLAFPAAAAFAAIRWRAASAAALIDRMSVSAMLGAALLLLYGVAAAALGWLVRANRPWLHESLTAGLLVVAAVTFAPTRAWLQRFVDLRLYRDYYELDATIQRFSEDLAALRDQEAVGNLLLDGLTATLNLTGCAFITLPEGLDEHVLALIEPADLQARREYAADEGRAQVLRGLAGLQHAMLLASARNRLALDPWPGCAALALVGPGAGREIAALLIVGPKRAGSPLRRADRSLLSTLAHQAGTALVNAQLVEGLRISLTQVQSSTAQLVDARADQQLLLRELVSADERQRAALARDLHDDALQEVLYMIRHSQVCMRLADAAMSAREAQPVATGASSAAAGEGMIPARTGGLVLAAPAHGRLHQELAQLAERSVVVERKLRELCLGLYPDLLHSLGLAVALEDLAEQIASSGETHASVSYGDDAAVLAEQLDADVALHMYRIAQEALRNAANHAHAQHITVRLCVRASDDASVCSHLELAVLDDGSGMAFPIDYGSLLRAGHLGLAGMRERAQSIGARLEMSTAREGGTHVVLSLPINQLNQLRQLAASKVYSSGLQG